MTGSDNDVSPGLERTMVQKITVESEIETLEQEYGTIGDRSGNVNVVECICRYPAETTKIQFPLHVQHLFNQDTACSARLERVAQINTDNVTDPRFVGYYTIHGEWVVCKKQSRSTIPDIFSYRSDPIRNNFETVLWDALWDETTDPLTDIELDDVELNVESRRAERPWNGGDEQ